jgi:hypothetical protein
MRRPWEVTPAARAGDADAGKIYHAVGLALSRWEILEVALSYLCGAILQAKPGAESTSYRKAAPGQPRLRLIEGALEAQRAAMPGPLHAEIAAFLDSEIAPLAERRNEIAHGTAVQAERGHYLVAPGYTPHKLQWRRVPVATDAFPFRRLAYAYTAAQVTDYGEHFFECSRRCFQLGNRLVEAREALSRISIAYNRRTLPLLVPVGARRQGPKS